MIRATDNYILRFGRLFHHWLVEGSVILETCRLDFIRQMQTTLRSETYQGLHDQTQVGDSNLIDIGLRVVLPPSFIGSPGISSPNQNAMALVQKYGKVDIFVTYTCSPAWDEIQRELLPGQHAADRPELICRVFNMRRKAFVHEVIDDGIYGEVVA